MAEIIIYSIFILILVSIGVIFLLVEEGPVAGFCFSVAVIIGILLNYSIDKFNNPERHRTLTIKEIKEYQIDSTLIISGDDTTKTYTITYFK